MSESQEEYAGMGTTFVAATVIGSTIYVMNIGDSRLYYFGEQLKQVTMDHSLVEEMVRMGELAKDAAKDHPDKNIITRAVGAAQDVDVDFFEVELYPQDYILMCSDGLTNMVEDEDILRIVKKSSSLKEAAQRLVTEANKNGGKDNISVVLAEF